MHFDISSPRKVLSSAGPEPRAALSEREEEAQQSTEVDNVELLGTSIQPTAQHGAERLLLRPPLQRSLQPPFQPFGRRSVRPPSGAENNASPGAKQRLRERILARLEQKDGENSVPASETRRAVRRRRARARAYARSRSLFGADASSDEDGYLELVAELRNAECR